MCQGGSYIFMPQKHRIISKEPSLPLLYSPPSHTCPSCCISLNFFWMKASVFGCFTSAKWASIFSQASFACCQFVGPVCGRIIFVMIFPKSIFLAQEGQLCMGPRKSIVNYFNEFGYLSFMIMNGKILHLDYICRAFCHRQFRMFQFLEFSSIQWFRQRGVYDICNL